MGSEGAMSDEERAEHVLSCLSSNYHIDPTSGSFTRRESDVKQLAAAFAAIREEVQREACDNLMIAIVPYLGRDQRVTKAAEQLAEYFEKHIRTGP